MSPEQEPNKPRSLNRTIAYIAYSVRKFELAVSPLIVLGEAYEVVSPYRHPVQAIHNTPGIETMLETGIGIALTTIALDAIGHYFSGRADRQAS